MTKADPVFFSVRGVKKTLGNRAILQGVDLDIFTGEILVLLGASGGGKSVLMRHLATLISPDEGQIWINGKEITKMSERSLVPTRKKLGIMFQDGALFDSLTVAENVAFPLYEQGHPDNKILQQKVEQILDRVGLKEHQKKLPADLSGGMRKRASLARTLVYQPQAILYDEPTAGLDPKSTKNIDQLILSNQKDLGVTSVVITHDMESAFHIADRIAFLVDGKIAWIDTPEKMKQSKASFIQEFLGTFHVKSESN